MSRSLSFNKNSFGEFFKRGILRGMSTCGEKNCATSKSNKIILSKSFFFKRFFILMKKSHGNQSRPAVIKFEQTIPRKGHYSCCI